MIRYYYGPDRVQVDIRNSPTSCTLPMLSSLSLSFSILTSHFSLSLSLSFYLSLSLSLCVSASE